MIKVMTPQLSNLIAAGEVVERPSNVIKELVENSLDALATKIDIYISEDGMSKISVVDNGFGMSVEDARLAVLRHATSKVYQEDDLNHIQTLGFRGEALAAIASVSIVEIMTKKEGFEGYYLKFIHGNLVEEKLHPTNVGTEVTVSQLFYQTPARFKFLSSDFQHQKQQRQLFYELALSRVDVAFTLYEQDKLFKSTSGSSDVKIAFSELYGSHYLTYMEEIHSSIQQTNIKLFVCSPEMHTHGKHLMFTYINHRFVKYYPLLDAMMDAYKPFLMTQRYPIVIAYISIDPSRVDVNRHPQKLVVKTTNESVLKYHLEQCIKDHFNKTSRTILRPLDNTIEPMTYHINTLDFDVDESFANLTPTEDIKGIPDLTYIGLLSGTYALFQHHDGLYLMDCHAAAERVRYSYYKALFKENFNIMHERLIPYSLDLDKKVYETYLNHKDVFLRYGFELDIKGVIKHPKLIKESDFELALGYIYDAYTENKPYDIFQLKDHLAKDISCKGAIKANHYLSKDEIMYLLDALKKVENPYQCPHGRPTIIMLSHYDIEKMFKRVVS